ncbi:Zinc finger CCCH domain-containing protein 64 [Morus notabilis]|uniref:Zinc finger CCCH domain-containing protein 64 n=1 Tax=Morus notabilis TaxID=981085 RepID=W9R9X0_9ROSA|nr:Zinc finger CCCH domain-containing protein 64 [Morus notabilis]
MVDGKEAAKRSTDGVSDSQYWRYDVSQKRQKHGDGDGNKLCFIFVSSGSCPRGEKCHFQHDADAREQSMRGVCLIFSTRENVKRVQIATSSTAYKMKVRDILTGDVDMKMLQLTGKTIESELYYDDYKRWSSLSLPPSPYWDRRHSLPRHSPLPLYKRPRRDDGGYDGRSPRGGFGPGDRSDYGSGVIFKERDGEVRERSCSGREIVQGETKIVEKERWTVTPQTGVSDVEIKDKKKYNSSLPEDKSTSPVVAIYSALLLASPRGV